MGTPTDQELAEVRTAVRGLVEEWQAAGRFTPACDSWLRRYDLEFSKALGARGLLGISWPQEYGGSERSGVARLVVTEELLRAGAPVAAHWIADRQIGPSILKHGTDAAKKAYLPGIARGEVTFCLGMSETESGSDLASVRTTATRTAEGWAITGRKIWTSQAHRSTHAYVLARTSSGASKHEGLTEFIVDMSHPGVEVRPIDDLRGEHHFNEVTFDAVEVPDDHVLGNVGGGWGQVTEQLSLERGGIERVMSTYPLLEATVSELAGRGDVADPGPTGEMMARLAVLRAMAFDVATAIDAGRAPISEAAMLKDLGTTFEREVDEYARVQLDVEPDPLADDASGLLAQGILAAPGFSIRGGTTEVLRTIVARGVPGRLRNLGREADEELRELRGMVDDALRGRGGEPGEELPDAWDLAVELGWPRVSVDEAHGGVGGISATWPPSSPGSLGTASLSRSPRAPWRPVPCPSRAARPPRPSGC
jgi:alkylation response protein AidB-like acyl-CoA dehydrogenase